MNVRVLFFIQIFRQTCGGCSYAKVGPEAVVTCQTAYFGRQLRKRRLRCFVFLKRYFWIWIAHSVMTRPFWQCADFIFFAQIAFRKCAAATAAGTEVIKTFSYKDEFLLSLVGVTCCYHPRHCCCCCCCNYCCFFCDTCTGQLFIWPVPFNHLPILFWIVLFPSPS